MQVESARTFALMQPGAGRERQAAEGDFTALFKALAKDAVAASLPEDTLTESARAPADAALAPPAEAESTPPVPAALPGESSPIVMDGPERGAENTPPAENQGLGPADNFQHPFWKGMNAPERAGAKGPVHPAPEESPILRGRREGGQDRPDWPQSSEPLADQPRPYDAPNSAAAGLLADSPMFSMRAPPEPAVDPMRDGSSEAALSAMPMHTTAIPSSPPAVSEKTSAEDFAANPLARLVDGPSPQAHPVAASARVGPPLWLEPQCPVKPTAEGAPTQAPIDTRYGAPLPVLALVAGQPDPALPTDQARLAPAAPALPPPTVQQVVQAAVRLADGAVELRLEPAELGRLHLSLIPAGEKMRVVIHAERPETLDLLRRHSADLERDLRALGYDTAEFRFSGQDQPASGFSRAQTRFVGLSGEAGEPAAPVFATAAFVAPGRLDLRL